LALLSAGAITVLASGTAGAAAAPAGGDLDTVRVSVSTTGTQADSYAYEPAISGDGRYVAYFSDASNLVNGDTNGWNDVFVWDSVTGAVERVSVTSTEEQVARGGNQPALSDDGRFVVFASDDPGLVPGDTNAFSDIFIRDRRRGTTQRVSVSTGGAQQTGGGAAAAEISGDGRYVVYWSAASDLVPGDDNDNMDVFRYDRVTGVTALVSAAADGTAAGGMSGYPGGPDISDDGRYVAFESDAADLVPDDGNGNALDVFVRDMATGRTRLVSVGSDGTPGDLDSYWPSISSDGRYVAFNSDATNLVGGDTNGTWDIFVRDRWRATTTRVSVATGGGQSDDISYPPDISGDGRYVAYFSIAGNLVPGDTNATWDVFVYDRITGRTVRASVSSAGREANGGSQLPSIDRAGRAVVYESDATSLVRPDTNRTTDAYLTLLRPPWR
jgi:Tol biopolymer transport system component